MIILYAFKHMTYKSKISTLLGHLLESNVDRNNAMSVNTIKQNVHTYIVKTNIKFVKYIVL